MIPFSYETVRACEAITHMAWYQHMFLEGNLYCKAWEQVDKTLTKATK